MELLRKVSNTPAAIVALKSATEQNPTQIRVCQLMGPVRPGLFQDLLFHNPSATSEDFFALEKSLMARKGRELVRALTAMGATVQLIENGYSVSITGFTPSEELIAMESTIGQYQWWVTEEMILQRALEHLEGTDLALELKKTIGDPSKELLTKILDTLVPYSVLWQQIRRVS